LYDVIIVGSGPAGLTAAIYTGRADLKTLVVSGVMWGGQLMLTGEVENYPGFKDGVMGPALMDNMLKQAERFGAEIVFDDVSAADFSSRPFKISVRSQVYEGRSVIIATGASPRWLGLENEARLRGRGVSVCATCDAAFFRDKNVVVVGGGDTAMEEALALSKFARDIKIVHRRDELRASKALQERVRKDPKIRILWSSVVDDIRGKDKVEGVTLRNLDSNNKSELQCDGVFIAIGHEPNTPLFRAQIELDERGYIATRDGSKTSIEGVFAAGDVHDQRYRQAVTAAGDGCKAAIEVEKYLGAS